MKKKTKCKRCGYEWVYKGKSTNPTCPKCKYKVYENIKKEGDTNERETDQEHVRG